MAAGLAGFLVTLGAGMWTGWVIRGDHEDARASRAPARDDGGRGFPPDQVPRPPLLPFPGQWALDIDADPFQGRTWLDALLEENGVSRDRA